MEAHRYPILASRFGENPTVVFWDIDGPFNDIYALGDASAPEAIKKLEQEGFLHKVFRPNGNLDPNNSIYISNLPLLIATFSILDQNNIMSVMASQKITYGYREEFVVKVLEAIRDGKALSDEDIAYLPKDDNGKVDFVALENALRMAFDDTPNECRVLIPILLDYLKGDKDAKKVLSEINTALENFYLDKENINEQQPLDRVLAHFKERAQGERSVPENLYAAADKAIPHRGYLRREPAEILGKAIAMRGLKTSADKSCYVTLAMAYLPECKTIRKGVLVDDQEHYGYTFVGTFVYADKTLEVKEPNLYLAQVLLETIPLKKLLQDLERFPDQKSANELRRLIVHDFVSKKKFEDLCFNLFRERDITTLVKLRAAYVKDLKLTPDEKKAEFKKYILDIIKNLNRNDIAEAVMLADLIKELESPFYNDLLRLETGFHGKAEKVISTLAGRPENPYGITNTWSTVVKAAKQRAEDILASKTHFDRITITAEQDQKLFSLFVHQTERIAFFKPSNLRNYQELKEEKKLIVKAQSPIIHPVNRG